jgi:hypothetical protein
MFPILIYYPDISFKSERKITKYIKLVTWHRFERDNLEIQLQSITAALTCSLGNRETLGLNLQQDHFTNCGLVGGDRVQSEEG